MLKLLFAFGLLFGPLYRFLSGVQHDTSRGGSSAPTGFLHFAPRFTVINRVAVPVNSHNVGSGKENGHNDSSKIEGSTTDSTTFAKLKSVKKAFLNSLG